MPDVVTPHPLAFCPPLEKMVSTGRTMDQEGKEVEVGAVSTVSNLLELRRQIVRIKPQRTLEVGLAYGGSALAITQSLRDVHGEAPWHHTAIDPCQSWLWGGAGRRAAQELVGGDRFTHIEDFSRFALARLAQEKQRFGLIYVDGSHLFEDVIIDLCFSMELLEPGGVVLFDDCTDRHVAKAMRFCLRNLGGILAPEPVDISHKSWKHQLANRLGYAQLRVFRKVAEPPRSHEAKLVDF